MPGIFSGAYNGSPDTTGYEQFLADTDPAQAAALPETIALTSMQIAGMDPSNFKNAVIGGDFTTNPWQRGTSFSSISNTLTYTADRFFAVGGASSSITVSRQALTSVNGVGNAARVQRAAANTDTAVINFGTAFTTEMSRRFQGKQVTLSFFLSTGANFSAVNSFVGVRAVSGRGTDQSAANMIAGSWTSQADLQLAIPTPGVSNVGSNVGGNPTSSIVAAVQLTNVTGVVGTVNRTRYQLTFTVPAAVTQLGFIFNFTPVGTAGANDWFQIDRIQVEEVAPSVPYATIFQNRPATIEAMLCQFFYWRLNEPATAAAVIGNGMVDNTNTQRVAIPTPVPMRIAPTVGVNAGTLRFNIGGVLTAVGGGFAGGATATQAPTCINVVGAVTATVAQATQLVSGAATWGGWVDATAEL